MGFRKDLQALVAQRGQPGLNDFLIDFSTKVAAALSEKAPAEEKDEDGVHKSFAVYAPEMKGLSIPKGQEARKLGSGPQTGTLPPGGTVIADPPPPVEAEDEADEEEAGDTPAPAARKRGW